MFHISLFKAMVINLGYILGIMTRPAETARTVFTLFYAETGLYKTDKDHKQI